MKTVYFFVALICVVSVFFSACTNQNTKEVSAESTESDDSNLINDVLQKTMMWIARSGNSLLPDTDFDAQKAQTEEIVGYIINGDQASMMSLFSESVLETVPGLDKDLNRLFDMLDGKITSWEVKSPINSASRRDGEVVSNTYLEAILNSSEEKFLLAIGICVHDTANERNVGLHTIYLVPAEFSVDSFEMGRFDDWPDGVIIAEKQTAT